MRYTEKWEVAGYVIGAGGMLYLALFHVEDIKALLAPYL